MSESILRLFRGSAGGLAALFAGQVALVAYAVVAPLATHSIVMCIACTAFTAFNWHSVVGSMASIAESKIRNDALEANIELTMSRRS